ncbi:NAD-dependent epimerase/dehydratase family protein [Aquiflexum lacus]|uniref:NAD-dependent epimerase/dehydratase family protein n=1 Tax=Aquiflexum lacus TaxID=2483805 RepID=UPI001892F62D|nr:NAD-dependent epimerase/dehydratase family protein [Aquiflexum lacus]
MKILISGGTGFVGKNLVSFLSLYGYDLIFVGRENGENQVSWRDLENKEFNVDVFIHLAGKAHDLKNVSNSQEYYNVNTVLTQKFFDAYLRSKAYLFIMLSSVKAVADEVKGILTEDQIPDPKTHYGKSKLEAENYLLKNTQNQNGRVIILRPCMIHGPHNKGNLNALNILVKKHIPWPLGAFENKRSFLSIDNLLFVIHELIENEKVPSGIYNISDDEAVSTNDLIKIIADANGNSPEIWNLHPKIIHFFAWIGDVFGLGFNSEKIQKLTENYVVSNFKLKLALGKSLPVDARSGLVKTIKSFK